MLCGDGLEGVDFLDRAMFSCVLLFVLVGGSGEDGGICRFCVCQVGETLCLRL
jgi:hypothetical protein